MTKATEKDEQISAFLDNELSHENCEQLISTLCKDEGLKSCLERYQLISDSMRNQLPSGIKRDFVRHVMSVVEAEPTILAPAASLSNKSNYQSILTRKAAGFAIAASVAAIAVIGVQSKYSEEPEQVATAMPDKSEFVRMAEENPVAANVQPVITSKPANGFATASTTVQQQPLVQQQPIPQITLRKFDSQLHQYIVNHSQYAAGAGVHDIISSARIVSSSQQKFSADQVKQ
ncbi:MAG: sigma-E factor negative regulatory protein [Gammaproteobacteria bacterium]|nr:sigma-E factor negative regulatory protein [Gammaproteobacteria bacterium]